MSILNSRVIIFSVSIMDVNCLIHSHPRNRFSPEGESGEYTFMVVENYIVYVHKDNLHLCINKRFKEIEPLIDRVFSLPYKNVSNRVLAD
jgi:hypothetical protein